MRFNLFGFRYRLFLLGWFWRDTRFREDRGVVGGGGISGIGRIDGGRGTGVRTCIVHKDDLELIRLFEGRGCW